MTSFLAGLFSTSLALMLFATGGSGQFARILESLERNLLTPIPLCFLLGIICTRIHGGIKIPKELYYSIAIFLLMSIGFIGGHELAHEYRRHCFQTAGIRQQFLFYAVGTKVSGISKSNIPKLKLPVPKVPEQTAIAEVLSDMDAELAALEQRLDKTRELKQGMMQELLTGRTRLV